MTDRYGDGLDELPDIRDEVEDLSTKLDHANRVISGLAAELVGVEALLDKASLRLAAAVALLPRAE